MSTRVVDRVDDWTQRPFDGGFRELQDLADSAFSGVVRAGGAELFMTRGAVVGIRRGAIEDFEESSGTVYDAPTDALPLLAVMQERSDEVRGKYYSEETGVSEVDRTLESGGFTGFVELSENVLSGDYYLVYHQGTSMSVAFVGNSGQLLTDDEAYERADDEVGIYEVRPVDIEPVEIPEPPEPDPVGGTVPDDGSTDEAPTAVESDDPPESARTVVEPDTEETDDSSEPEGTEESPADPDPADAGAAAHVAPEADAGAERVPDSTGGQPEDRAETSTADPVAEAPADSRGTAETPPERQSTDANATTPQQPERAEQEPETGSETDTSDVEQTSGAHTETPPTTDTGEQETETVSREAETRAAAGQTAAAGTEPASPADPEPPETPSERDVPPTPSQSGHSAAGAIEEESSATEDPGSLERRAIPSLDPERTSSRARSSSSEPRRDTPGRSGESQASTRGPGAQSTDRREGSTGEADESPPRQRQQSATEDPDRQETRAERTDTESEPEPEPTADEARTEATADSEPENAASGRVEELQALLTEREKEIERLESSLETAETDRDAARRELKQLRQERDELEEQVETLESELQRLEEELGAATDAQQRMTPQEALSGTDIFVRYRSKGDATLEKAHESGAVKKDVVENLRLEKHTQFDADISAVGGREYDEFLEDTVAYRFVRWVVEDLIFEIQGTGHTETLSELYDALPKINRVELNGAVNVTYTEDGQETEATESFDVVFRERMGDPLLVANINESRQGASDAMMENLITAAERVGQTSDQFGSAFLVTESFFEPEALETVAEATRGGILSRDKRKSFVNLSRKRGYHLCLVEARNQNFHLEVPEL